MIPAHVGQKLLSHDGVRNRATKTRVKTESQSDSCPFQSRLLIPYAPEVRGTSEEAAREFQHLISRRHFAPPGIGSSRLFSSGPPSVRLTAVCARALTPLREGRDRWASAVQALGRRTLPDLAFPKQLVGLKVSALC